MKKNKLNYNILDFKKEWLLHKKCKEWWYATGILFDDNKNMYSYQYTLLNINLGIITIHCPMIAFTDYSNNKHYYLQNPTLNKKEIIINEKEASFNNIASVIKTVKGMEIELKHSSFELSLNTEYNKKPVWHCDNGVLQMGISGKKEKTFYYSYTNMPTKGKVILKGKELKLQGKTWFDKQGGTYSIMNDKTHWEWFSLRFFDDEEIMLFTFPQHNYYDGTYIKKDGSYIRMNNYKIKTTKIIEYNKYKWSAGWDLELDIKDKNYKIEPVQKGHINFVYFEELCYIKNMNNEIVGYCFAELLPGVLNDYKAKNNRNLFKKIEY